ncbi:MAG: hypothetical protein H6739_18805 [Alphaproteobacteria bacterium]|nr:hypothetical protein [Alphaproteobacteria bacterium]
MPDVNPRYFDVRVVEKYIEQGVITREQYEAWLDSQEDVSGRGQETRTRMTTLSMDDLQDN